MPCIYAFVQSGCAASWVLICATDDLPKDFAIFKRFYSKDNLRIRLVFRDCLSFEFECADEFYQCCEDFYG